MESMILLASFWSLLLITAILLALCMAGLGIRMLLIKGGRFPETHIGRNKNMKKLGITCAKDESAWCQGRKDAPECQGCGLRNARRQ